MIITAPLAATCSSKLYYVAYSTLQTPPDGEATVDPKDIDRGYAQFCAAMY